MRTFLFIDSEYNKSIEISSEISKLGTMPS
jgi:hypothetical protein